MANHNTIYYLSSRYTIFYTLVVSLLLALELLSLSFAIQSINGQVITQEDLVTYDIQSNYIKEFKIPLKELGLKGITTDSQGNVWFYHSTNKTSTIITFDPQNEQYKQYDVEGKTVVNDAIINLAGGQLVFDNARNVVWFTDARTNSIGMLDAETGKNQLFIIPTPDSGPMGITLSPDGEKVWFTEITGNKIATLDLELINSTKNISTRSIFTEYPLLEKRGGQISDSIGDVGSGSDNGGPTLLAFDSKGILWVTMSYSHDILKVEPWALISGSRYMGISNFSLPKPDTFSPFGIAIIDTKNASNYGIINGKTNFESDETQRIFVSDHGSSRVILGLGNLGLDPFQNYISYWTSLSQAYPVSLPSQIVADGNKENIYFVQHGGNRISKIDVRSGVLTEYDIPTGPLSTAVFLAMSDDGKKVWFTEYAANKIAYLDTIIPVPLDLHVNAGKNENNNDNASRIGNDSSVLPLVLKPNEDKKVLEVLLKVQNLSNNNSSNNELNPFSSMYLDEVELSAIGMSDSGLVTGVTYVAHPQRINISNDGDRGTMLASNRTYNSQIEIALEKSSPEIRPGEYTMMIKSSMPESIQGQVPLFLSLLYPIPVLLDVPMSTQISQQEPSGQNLLPNINSNNQAAPTPPDFFGIKDISLLSIIRTLSLAAAIGLIGYIIYARIKRSSRNRTEHFKS